MQTPWTLISDGTACGTKIFHNSYEVDNVMSVKILILPGQLVTATIEFATAFRIDCADVEIKHAKTNFNTEITAYVKDQLRCWLNDRDFKLARNI